MGSGVDISFRHPLEFAAVCLLVALFSAAGGLALGCSIGQTQVGPDVQPGAGAHDDVRLRLLSVGFAAGLSRSCNTPC